ncbi:MAG: hypothetical protein ACLQVI_14175 [Polyangiaceae bacterium]
MLRVYLAAPFLDAPVVRDLGATLEALGIGVTSTWARHASGPEALGAMPVDEVRRIALANDRDLLAAHLVVALAREGGGAEMFAEVRLALAHRIPVVWIGTRRPLSAYREGVLRVASLAEGVKFLSEFGEILGELAPFEKRKGRETLWEVVEPLSSS